MYTYKCLNPIAKIGLANFPNAYEQTEDEDPDLILVRSAVMHDMQFGKNLMAVARAGAGVNNIPLDRCAKEGIVVFNTPGANANGVKELFIFALISSLRDVIGGINWTKSQAGNENIAALTEKEKKKFVGNEAIGRTLGVIGLGAIGAKVANTAVSLGMNAIGYDAFLNDSMKAALDPAVKIASSNEEVVASSDIITLHVPALAGTIGMINEKMLSYAKDNLIVINLARDTLVDTASMKAALESGKVAKYFCDFPTAETSVLPNTILSPHLGASTEESEDNCAIMAVKELVDFVDNGNIKNSVNYPAVSLGAKNDNARIAICHMAVVDSSDITAVLKSAGSNIIAISSKTKGDYSYTLIDADKVDNETISALTSKEGVIKVRIV